MDQYLKVDQWKKKSEKKEEKESQKKEEEKESEKKEEEKDHQDHTALGIEMDQNLRFQKG